MKSLIPNIILSLNKLLYIPKITKNLLSMPQFTKDNGVVVEFYDAYNVIKDKVSRQVLLEANLEEGLHK